VSSTTLDTLALAVAKSNKAGLGTAWTTKEDLCSTSVSHVKLAPAAGAVEAEVISLSSTDGELTSRIFANSLEHPRRSRVQPSASLLVRGGRHPLVC